MADNVAVTAGSGTTIATDDIAGVQVQRVKTTWGPDGTMNDADVATGKPLPTQLRSPTGVDLTGAAGTASAAVLTVQGIASGTAQPVSAASLPLPSGASTAAKQPALGTAGTASTDVITVQGIASGVAQPASQSGTWNVTNVSGTVSLPTGAATEATLAAQSGKLPATLGAKTAATSLSVTQASDISFGAAVTLTRPNDTNAYAANDVIGAATGSTAALTFALGAGAGEYMITSSSLEIDATAVISGETSYILYLYNVTPPSALGDNVAWDLPSGDRASFLGSVNLGTPIDLGSTLYVEASGINKQITLASANVFGYVVTVGAYTPTASRVRVITLHSVKV